MAYHPQANGAVKSFNKTLHKGLTKICGLDRDDWDDKVPMVLWAYRTAYKILTGQTPFKLVYGQEVIIPLHFYENAGRITFVLEFDHILNTRQHFYQVNKLEEERMLAQQHQEVQKNQQKSWHDQHIKKKDIKTRDLVLMYDSRIKGKPWKLETACWVLMLSRTSNHQRSSIKNISREPLPKIGQWGPTKKV
jgi:hypothetical protein